MKLFSPVPTVLQAYTAEDIARARYRAKTGALVAMLSIIVFVCLTSIVAVLSVSAGHLSHRIDLALRAAMSVALLCFFVGSHVWMLAPFFYKKETSAKRLAQLRRLRLQAPDVAAMLDDIDAQRRPVLRGEADAILKMHRRLLSGPGPRMKLA